MESEDYSAAEDADPYTTTTTTKGRLDRKRRFSEVQIKSLESMFESQAKLEPRNKLQLARELGLQPRQVAIWFQNKRARWKSKQLEHQYAALRTEYDTLLCSVDALKREKQLLIKQLQTLAGLLKLSSDSKGDSSGNTNTDDKETKDNVGMRPSIEEGSDLGGVLYSYDEKKMGRHGGHDEDDPLYLGEPCSTSANPRGSCSPENNESLNLQWWESWPLIAD